ANLELLLQPARLETHDFRAGQTAIIDADACTACGRCAEVCRFEAVVPGPAAYCVNPINCEGCASCTYQCPADAIRMQEAHAGQWFRSDTRYGPLFHAHLFAGQENSGKLVTLVKQHARLLALDTGADLLIVDGPPGIGCPVIAASAGADLALLVVEPTVAGVHDLERILGTVNHFGVPALVCINKADINPARAAEIAAYCQEQGVPVAGPVPYDDMVTRAMVQGQPVTAYAPDGAVTRSLWGLWEQAQARLRANGEH
ncbi:MAG: 4Fe-4S binding protein, partial [Chloroflexi bacterium]|nr:4Fe-4S binding protein [Chloroflexota bacterium]